MAQERLRMPRYIALKANFNNKYLRYMKDDENMSLHFSGDDVLSPDSKFEVELAGIGNGLVNIRSCYNNKYWASLKEIQPGWGADYIVAAADKPEEDQSKWACTLFEPVYVDDARTIIRFRHIHKSTFVECSLLSSDQGRLTTGWTTQRQLFTIVDWESLFIFPNKTHIVFKGFNDLYLGNYTHLLQKNFVKLDKHFPGVRHEVVVNEDANVQIKSDGKFWRREDGSNNWIKHDSVNPSSTDLNTLFRPLKVSDHNVIGLINLGNNNICNAPTEYLSAGASNISDTARFEVEEHVLSRTIYNARYRLNDARIYNENPTLMDSGSATNRTSSENTMEITFRYSESRTRTWNASVSMMYGITSTMDMGIPFIWEQKIEIRAEIGTEYNWGESTVVTNEREHTYRVLVPPMTKVTVKYLATQGTCDVPFSYTQRDEYSDGTSDIFTLEDGLFTGVNAFNFYYESTEEKL